jgi:acetyl-CoA acyltransferase
MCAGAMTTTSLLAAAIGADQYDIAIAGGVEHMGHHPMGFDADPNPRFLAEKMVSPDALNMGITAERLHDRFPRLTKERADHYAMNSQLKVQAAYERGDIQKDLVPVALRSESGWGMATEDQGRRPGNHDGGTGGIKNAFPPARPGYCR